MNAIPTYNPLGEPKRFTEQQIEHNRRLADMQIHLRAEAQGYSRWTRARRAKGLGTPAVEVTATIALEDGSRGGRFALLRLDSTATGPHAISEPFNTDADVQHALERFRAHFDGFLAGQPVKLPESGNLVTFQRGMFGAWTGTVDRACTPKLPESERYFMLKFTRRNGARATYKAFWSDLERSYSKTYA
jgi:hypothetical protein